MAQKLFHGLLILLLLFLLLRKQKGTSQATSKVTPVEPPKALPPAGTPKATLSQKELKIRLFSERLRDALATTVYSDYINFWMAVAKMETAGFDSSIFRIANNPWNMEKPYNRNTTARPVAYNGRWAMYASLKDAADDILLYMKAKQFKTRIQTIDDFVREMGRLGYYGKESADSYLKKVKAWQEV